MADSDNASSLELRLSRVSEEDGKRTDMREQTFPFPYIMSVTSRAKRGKSGRWARSIDGVSPFSMFSHLLRRCDSCLPFPILVAPFLDDVLQRSDRSVESGILVRALSLLFTPFQPGGEKSALRDISEHTIVLWPFSKWSS